jgi:hypothetical protein
VPAKRADSQTHFHMVLMNQQSFGGAPGLFLAVDRGHEPEPNIDAELICAAFEMRLRRRCPQREIIHRSERGAQHASMSLKGLLQRRGSR